jgi:propanol-preferring alcohol dehydrogenase
MKAMILEKARPIERDPLLAVELPTPAPGPNEIRIRVRACGVCHTDLHTVEGDLPLPRLPLIPGHQVVGLVESVGENVTRFRVGERVGVPWLYSACGECAYCRRGNENLCEKARFSGYHVDGGYAQYMVAPQDFAYHIPESSATAPCA